MIKKSQSMNDEERQYWVDVLLIMTEEQIKNLHSILGNEKKQIDEANRQYQEEMTQEESKVKIHFDEIKYKEKKRVLMEAEGKAETEESKTEAALLQQIGKM